jgi:hypothetical protein
MQAQSTVFISDYFFRRHNKIFFFPARAVLLQTDAHTSQHFWCLVNEYIYIRNIDTTTSNIRATRTACFDVELVNLSRLENRSFVPQNGFRTSPFAKKCKDGDKTTCKSIELTNTRDSFLHDMRM